MNNAISRLGFGLSSIAGSGNFSHQQKLIETAIDNGVTHFDVAPFYGSGDAEKILGKILATTSNEITITTKYGLTAFASSAGGSAIRKIARPLFRKISGLKKLASVFVSKAHAPQLTSYQPGALTKSLDDSIRNIGRPIDIFLLHDVNTNITSNEALLAELSLAKEHSKTVFNGISGSLDELESMSRAFPRDYTVFQTENSLTNGADLNILKKTGAKIITHRCIQGGLKALNFLMESRPGFRQIWKREIGIDPKNEDDIAKILIELALYENPTGTILFSTTKVERIKMIANVINTSYLSPMDCIRIRQLFNDVHISDKLMATQ
ncbi:aldo/keto reductase [Pedobacter mucosus]|uniref:aldo/keto reductase n=1 Tax=Pedobacter mucosus TaxID=2895286 RepID=UPI001EE418AA|nr:aldo/keto reductase [Pedobacter mucosus]UKT62243.1 aldo/keto reductase [Pedobacter mucosus]